MAIVTRKPPMKETVGAQYICFCNPTEAGDWQNDYEAEVEKTEVVKSIKAAESAETTPTYASGSIYETSTSTSATEIEVQVIAFTAETLAKMRSDKVDEGGLVLSGGSRKRPYFAYGKVVKLGGGKVRFDWFPKCVLVENSDESATKEEKFSEQPDTIKIAAYPFNAEGDNRVFVDSSMAIFPIGLTEEKFFAKPILSKEDLAAAVGK